VRREHEPSGTTGRADLAGPRHPGVDPPGREGVQAVGVDEQRAAPAAEQRKDEALRLRRAAQPGTEHQGIPVAVPREDRLPRRPQELPALPLRKRKGHRLGHLGLEDRIERARQPDPDEPRPGPQRSRRGQGERPGQPRGASDDEQLPPIPLVRVGRARGEQAAIRRRFEQLRRGADLPHHLLGVAEIDQVHLPDVGASRRKEEADFQAPHRHGPGGTDSGSRHRAGVGVEPGGDVDGHDPGPSGVHRVDPGDGFAADRPRQARAENGVDDQVVRTESGEALPLPLPRRTGAQAAAQRALRVRARIRLELRDGRGGDDVRPEPALAQQAREDVAVAAVVPLATDDDDAAAV